MKKFMFLFVLVILTFMSFAQAPSLPVTTPEKTEQTAKSDTGAVTTITDVANSTVQVLTDDPNAKIKIPEKVNPTDSNSLNVWWWFIYGLLMPIGTFIFNRFFPSSHKRALILKSTSFAVLALIVLLNWQNYSVMAVMQGVIGFVMQFFMYDKFYNPIGLKSPRNKNYTA